MDLKALVQKEIMATTELLDQFPWDDPRAYADWLSQTYHFVSHTTRLLALAAGVARLDQQTYHQQFLYHLKEEYGHEKIALSDLKHLGCPLTPELNETHRFYETVRTLIQSQGPLGLFGYMHFLEALAVHSGPQIFLKVKKHYGDKCGRFLSVHGEEDSKHVEETLKTFEQAPAEDMEIVFEGLQIAGDQYRAILSSLLRTHARQIAAAA